MSVLFVDDEYGLGSAYWYCSCRGIRSGVASAHGLLADFYPYTLANTLHHPHTNLHPNPNIYWNPHKHTDRYAYL